MSSVGVDQARPEDLGCKCDELNVLELSVIQLCGCVLGNAFRVSCVSSEPSLLVCTVHGACAHV